MAAKIVIAVPFPTHPYSVASPSQEVESIFPIPIWSDPVVVLTNNMWWRQCHTKAEPSLQKAL